MRIAIGEFAHETNTFCPGFTELDAFNLRSWSEGEDLIPTHTGVRNDIGGMIAAAEELGIELVPTLATSAQPSATVSAHAYTTIRDTMFGYLKDALPVDAVVLALHGAGTADGMEDLEGTFLTEVRELVGYDIPLVVTLDLHGNTTETMIKQANALLYCHEYPHIDMYERGYEAIGLTKQILEGTLKPVKHLARLPIQIPGSTTFQGPARVINQKCLELEKTPGAIDVNFTHGFPHTDVSVITTSVLVTTDNDPALAEELANQVIALIYETIEDFRQDLPNPKDVLKEAMDSDKLPVVIAEVSDNAGGGSPSDGTHLLRELLALNEPKTAFGFIYDPKVAAQAHEAGCGATIDIKLGAFTDDLHGTPIETTAYVKSLSDGRFKFSTPMGAGAAVNLGNMARLVIGNVDVIVGSHRSQTLDKELFALNGIDVREYRIVCLKSMQHFRAGFEPLAGLVLRTDPPGFTTSNLLNMPYTKIKRPIWPLDPLPEGGIERFTHQS